jgi:hypothetical protein
MHVLNSFDVLFIFKDFLPYVEVGVTLEGKNMFLVVRKKISSQKTIMKGLSQCFSTGGPRPRTGPLSYRKKNLPGHGLTKVENHWFKLTVDVYTVTC